MPNDIVTILLTDISRPGHPTPVTVQANTTGIVIRLWNGDVIDLFYNMGKVTMNLTPGSDPEGNPVHLLTRKVQP